MAPANPQKKRKVIGELSKRASPHDEMDIDNGIGIPNDSVAGLYQGKKRGRDVSTTTLGDAKLLNMYEYKSNVFRMETDEMLAEVRVDYQKRMGSVEKVLHKLKNIIDNIPGNEPTLLVDVENDMLKKHKITIPFPTPKPAKDVKYKFAYEKPSYMNVVGSFAMKTMVKNNSISNVDLVIQMPSSLFQEKDYLNHRYFHKRAYYLACLTAGIYEARDFRANLSYDFLHGDVLRPILVVSPSPNTSEYDFTKSKCIIRLIPCIYPDVFPTRKLTLTKNCVRPTNSAISSLNSLDASYPPTPSYNSSVLADTAYLYHHKLLNTSASHCAAFRDACILGRIWLKQRGFTSELACGGFGNFEWSVLLAYLMKTGGPMGGTVLAGGYSNYQLFKATLQFLATRDLTRNHLMVNGTVDGMEAGDTPILIDGAIGLNILFKTSLWSYTMLRHEANLTLKALNNSTQLHFGAIFLNRVEELYLRYDLVVSVPVPTGPMVTADLPGSTDETITFARRLYRVLLHSLTDRIKMVNLKLPQTQSWDVQKMDEKFSGPRCITIGILLNDTKCHRLMDHGPSAENKKEAASFRQFWGKKAELRRFKDGNILESVFWGESKDHKLPVIHQIIVHIVERYFGPEVSQGITFIGDQYAQLLSNHQSSGPQVTITPFQPIMTGYETLVKDLRSIEDMPLIIRHITPISPALRFSTIQPPLVGPDKGPLETPADIALQFESSGRWPDDLIAIQRTKVAFLLRIGQLLEQSSSDGSITTRVGLENQEPGREIFNASFLDVIYHSGPTFRVRIHHEREPFLLERRSKDTTLAPHLRDIASQALVVYNYTFIKLPLHTASLTKLCYRYALLSPTIRLVKIWFSAHLLMCHFSDELIEVIVSRQFVSPFPWTTPSSIMTGFLRTLEYLANWDWHAEPLIVDTSDGGAVDLDTPTTGTSTEGLRSTDIESITNKFRALRKSDPGLNRAVLFVATSYDHDGLAWTESSPSRVAAARMTALARSAMEHVKQSGSNSISTLFTHVLSDYDFVIHLNPAYLTGPGTRLDRVEQHKNVLSQRILRVGFNPAGLFLQDLQKIYTTSLVFFHGSPSTKAIGCLWTPHATNSRKWKINVAYSSIPAIECGSTQGNGGEVVDEQERSTITINKPAILNEIARLGGEFIEKIEVNR